MHSEHFFYFSKQYFTDIKYFENIEILKYLENMIYKPVFWGLVLNSASETFFAEIATCELYTSKNAVSLDKKIILKKIVITEKFVEQDMRL